MKKNLFKKGVVIGIIILFIGLSVVPSISGHVDTIYRKSKENKDICEASLDMIFYDDFDDNVKDFNKWEEVFTTGSWEEINQRAEFELYESSDSQHRFEGIESTAFTVTLSENNSIDILWDVITNVGSTGWVGQVCIRITDGTNWITARYMRAEDQTAYWDSKDGTEYILESGKGDGSWSNNIQLFSDKYQVTMDGVESGWIYNSVFASNPTLEVQIFIAVAGSTPSVYTRSGFDNITVQGDVSLFTRILDPEDGDYVNKDIIISGIADSLNGHVEKVQVRIDDSIWYDADGNNNWIFEFNTTTLNDGIHFIYARCINDSSSYSDPDKIMMYIDNTGPDIDPLFPLPGYLHIFGRLFIRVKIPIIIGALNVLAKIEDEGVGNISEVKFYLGPGILNPGMESSPDDPIQENIWQCSFSGITNFRFGSCEIDITAYDSLGNKNNISQFIIKIA